MISVNIINYIMNYIYNQVVMYTTNCVYSICKYIVSLYKGRLKCVHILHNGYKIHVVIIIFIFNINILINTCRAFII